MERLGNGRKSYILLTSFIMIWQLFYKLHLFHHSQSDKFRPSAMHNPELQWSRETEAHKRCIRGHRLKVFQYESDHALFKNTIFIFSVLKPGCPSWQLSKALQSKCVIKKTNKTTNKKMFFHQPVLNSVGFLAKNCLYLVKKYIFWQLRMGKT